MKQPEEMVPLKGWQRTRCSISFPGETLAKQAFKAECDINTIMTRFEKTGLLEHVNQHQGDYGDYTNVPADYQAALDQVMAAREMFGSVPSKIRARFENDPAKFLAFVEDPANAEEMYKLGLAKRPEGSAPPCQAN